LVRERTKDDLLELVVTGPVAQRGRYPAAVPVLHAAGSRALVLAALAAVLAAIVAGCGADTENGGGKSGGGLSADDQVRAVVARFGIATRNKDYQAICDRLLADVLIAKMEAVGLPCESTLKRGLGAVHNPTLSINQVSIAGGRALVSIHTTASGQPPSDDALQLVRQSGEWRIASLTSPTASPAKPSTTAPSTTTTSTTTATTPTTTTRTTTTRTTPTTRTTATTRTTTTSTRPSKPSTATTTTKSSKKK
jgi:hypothetical protein